MTDELFKPNHRPADGPPADPRTLHADDTYFAELKPAGPPAERALLEAQIKDWKQNGDAWTLGKMASFVETLIDALRLASASPVSAPPCKKCEGRGWIMDSFDLDLGGGLRSGGSWNKPCPDCASPVSAPQERK